MTSAQQSQPSEEELRAYLEQLRSAEPSQIIVQAFSMLGTGAEVKLGRTDARVLIDAMAAMVEAARPSLPADLAEQMVAGVRQLQLAQVQLEQQQGSAQAEAGAEPAAQPTQEAPAQPSAPAAGEQPDASRITDRLWIPGRETPPPRPR